jgi:ribonuclease HI
MPWKRAQLRNQRVYVRVDAGGQLALEAGRVEVRYKPNDGRAYRAAASNIEALEPEMLPEETCGVVAPVEAAAAASSAGPKRSMSAGVSSSRLVPEHAVVAYTDGACSGNPGPAGSGMRLQHASAVAEGYSFLGEATNNVAELTAIRDALLAIPNEVPVVVHTDSQYAIGVLQKGWKAKANQVLIAEIRKVLAARSWVELVYVRGHAGDPGNERADELARAAITTRSSKPLPFGFGKQ